MSSTQPKKPKKSPPLTAEAAAEPVDAFNDAVVGVMMQTTESYIDWLSTWNREVAEFMGRRLARQQAFAARIAACSDSAAIVECHRQWSAQAHQDYADEYRKLTELGVSFAQKQAAATEKVIKANGGS